MIELDEFEQITGTTNDRPAIVVTEFTGDAGTIYEFATFDDYAQWVIFSDKHEERKANKTGQKMM